MLIPIYALFSWFKRYKEEVITKLEADDFGTAFSAFDSLIADLDMYITGLPSQADKDTWIKTQAILSHIRNEHFVSSEGDPPLIESQDQSQKAMILRRLREIIGVDPLAGHEEIM